MEQISTTAQAQQPKPGRRKVTAAVYINALLLEQVDALARDTLATRSAIVTQALLNLLEAQGEY